MIITSAQNPLAKKISSLSEKKYRKLYGEYLVEGVKPVRECLRNGGEITRIVCTIAFEKEFEDAVIFSDSLFERVSTEKSPQGVLATVKIPQNELVAPESSCLLLDGLQDCGNLGTIIRTANAAGYSDIYLINCADAYAPKTVRASMSGIFFVKIMTGDALSVLDTLKGVTKIAADMDGDNIFSFRPPEKFCLCIGNEGNGLSKEVMSVCDKKIAIPMRESCESLNAAVSAGIAMYQLKLNKEV